MRKRLVVIAGSLSCALIGCGSEDAAGAGVQQTGEERGSALGQPASAERTSQAAATGPAAVAPAAGEADVDGTSGASGTGDLTAYVGKYPFDDVGGVTWKQHPLIQAGIRKSVTDPAVRAAIALPDGPSAPIAMYRGKVGAWGCQAHNCGDHQWAVLVDPASGATDVCYHDAAKTGENSRWFLASGKEETRPGNCSVV